MSSHTTYRSLTMVLSAALTTFLFSVDTHAAFTGTTTETMHGASSAARSVLKPLRVRSLSHLKQLLTNKGPQARTDVRDGVFTLSAGPAMKEAASTAVGASNDYSNTNVQVEGVDEGDLVKTDGRYLYTLQGGQLRIIQAYPATNMSVLASITFEDGFYPSELYIEGDRLVVIGNAWIPDTNKPPTTGENGGIVAAKMFMPIMGQNITIARVFDISDRQHPVKEREVSFTGNYLSSRKIGDAIYLVGRTYPRYYTMAATFSATTDMTRDSVLPKVGDTAVNGGVSRSLPLSSLAYFPDFVDPNYVIVAGFRLKEPNRPADIKSYLGAGEITYASLDTLYLSAADYQPEQENTVTHLYSFAMDHGDTQFRNAGEVPGTVLNQFSMDEHDGYFRIATTVHQWRSRGEIFQDESWNNLYTLDGNMKVVGKIEHLAEGERIYSARFMGDRAYLVTFKQTDPLFVIDLSDPISPKILGELKLPGFSNYLHPFDEQHLIGIGHDTYQEGDAVRVSGMKLALFDVSNVSAPKLDHSLIIGQQGTYSEALYDQKAVLFDPARHLLAFPISETAMLPGDTWPSTVFQGAYAYSVTLEGGFKQIGAVTHMPEGNLNAWNRYVRRALTIGNDFYTLSEGRVQANSLDGFAQTGALDILPLPEDEPLPVPIESVDPIQRPEDSDSKKPDEGAPIVCTLDVKICPGGMAVSRQGPSCDFAPCPE